MKRSLLVVFSVILLCGILLPTAVVNAYYEGTSNCALITLQTAVLLLNPTTSE